MEIEPITRHIPTGMKTRDFFRKIGIGAAAVIAAPQIVKAVKEEKPNPRMMYSTPEGTMSHYRFVKTTTPTKMNTEPGGMIVLNVDEPMLVGDTFFIDPKYTNKPVPTTWYITGAPWVVLRNLGLDGRSPEPASYQVEAYPLDATVKMVKSMRKGVLLDRGPKIG